MNFKTLDIDGEYAELPDGLRHKVVIEVPAASISYSLNLCETVGKKITYSFPGYTDQDQEDIDNNDGIPPVGVDMVPTLKLEGTVVAQSPGIANPGTPHGLYTTFFVPGQGSDDVAYTVLTGGYYAIGLDPQFVSNAYLSQRIADYIATLGDVTETGANRDDITGEALYLAVMKYFNDVNTSDQTVASLYHTAYLKQTAGRLSAIEDPNANAMGFSYTAGQLTGITDTVGRAATIAYNTEGRIGTVSIDAPSPGPYTWTYAYDGNGDLVSVSNPRGHQKNYNYDATHNLIAMTFYEGGVFAYDYYSDDRVHTNTLPNGGQFVYSYYNTDLRITIVEDPEGHKTTFYYDDDGALTSMLDSDGFEEKYALDADKRKVKITDKRGNRQKIVYDAMGNLLAWTNALNQTTTYTYASGYNRMASMTDALGRTILYRYDTRGNLLEVEAPSGEISAFTYDLNGDLLTATDTAGQTTTYAYDGYGYLAMVTDALGHSAYFINDFLGNPISKTDKNGNAATYVHDLKLCTQATDAAGTTRYVYAGQRDIMETDGSGAVTAKYIYGSGLDEVLRMTLSGTDYYYHRDGLNSVLTVTDASGTPVESYRYEAFGQPAFFDGTGAVLSQSTIGNAYLFTGRRFDPQTGLYYFCERYYNPATGRFTGIDPIGHAGGLNLYTYVFNDPVNLVDPFGLYWNYGGGYNQPGELKGDHRTDAVQAAELTQVMDLIKEYGEYRFYAGSHLDSGNCTTTYPDFVEWYENKYNGSIGSIDELNASLKYYEIQPIAGGYQPPAGDVTPGSYGHHSMGIVEKAFHTNPTNINHVVGIYDPIGHPTVVNYDPLGIVEGIVARLG